MSTERHRVPDLDERPSKAVYPVQSGFNWRVYTREGIVGGYASTEQKANEAANAVLENYE